jgi:hypothetical protein
LVLGRARGSHGDKWNSTYDLLMKYTAEHGTSRAPYDSVYKGVKVGQCASLQRSSYAKGKLSEERRRKLANSRAEITER